MAGSSAWQARAQAQAHGKVRRGVGASAGRPTVRDEPGIHTTARRERQRAPRIALGHEAAARREAGSRSRVSAAQRAPSRSGTAVPKDQDVRTPSRRQVARICRSTERSRAWHRHQWRLKHGANVSGLTASPTRSVFPGARAHMCVCSARLGPRTCARAHVGGIITQPLSAST